MRPLSEIKLELEVIKQDYHTRRKELEQEIEVIQEKCPHPDGFLKVDHNDYDDDCMGPGRYDHSMTKVTCLLCEKMRYSETYDKKHKTEMWKDYRPDSREVINS